MKITGAGFEQGAKGVGILVLVAVGGYLGWKGFGLLSTLVSGVGSATTATGEALGGSVYTLVNGDANTQTQSNVQQAEAALKAAGNPPPGTQQYNDIVEKFGIAGAPLSIEAG